MLKQKKRKQRGKQQKTKRISTSFGIACLRYSKENELEILLIKKRCTYMYASFLNGLYKKKDIVYLNTMFNGMTRQEKNDILTLDFEKMWSRMYINVPQKKENIYFDIKLSAKSTTDTYEYIKTYDSYYDLYMKKKRKFESLFFYNDSLYIINLINNSTDGIIKWEIPRGKKEKDENMLDCAIREFGEETGSCVDDYKILFEIEPVIDSYISSSVHYLHTYYLALNSDCEPVVRKGISEIDELEWLNVNALKYIKGHSYIFGLIKTVVNKYKCYLNRQ